MLSKYTPITELKKFNVPKNNRLIAILGSHNLIVSMPDGNRIEIGRGSIGALKCVRYYASNITQETVLKIGEFCEFSDAKIIVGGEHLNKQAINYTFSALPILASFIKSQKIDCYLPITKGKICIGDFSILSQDSIILSGSEVGSGCIIGAGAVVSGKIPNGFIGIGSPAKLIPRKMENDFEKQFFDSFDSKQYNWDVLLEIFDYYAAKNFEAVMNLIHCNEKIPVDEFSNAICFDAVRDIQGKIELRNLVGLRYRNQHIRAVDLPPEVISYIKQAINGDGEMDWTIDLFAWCKFDLDALVS